jgi:DNA replication licensing factor MCM7
LVESIEKNTKRYIDVISQAVDSLMPKETKDVTYVEVLASANFQTN